MEQETCGCGPSSSSPCCGPLNPPAGRPWGWRRLVLPGAVFLAVLMFHFGWLGIFPECNPAQDRWSAISAPQQTWLQRYVEAQGYWLGFSYAMSLSFAAVAFRRYREQSSCATRNVAIGSAALSGALPVAGCFLVGCCGSPMLVVYLNLFGAAFLPFAKPLVAGVTLISIILAWWWMSRNGRTSAAGELQVSDSVSPARADRGIGRIERWMAVNRTVIAVGLVLMCVGAGVVLRLARSPSRDGNCCPPVSPSSDVSEKVLTIRWQRLLDTAGQTCDRCGNTGQTIEQAQQLLAAALKPLGLRVTVLKTALTPAQFALDPSQSNQIWVGDEPLEKVLGAKTGSSQCAGVCGKSPCRTMVVDGRTYEAIPPELIVGAGLKVAADMIQRNLSTEPSDRAPGCTLPAETITFGNWSVVSPGKPRGER